MRFRLKHHDSAVTFEGALIEQSANAEVRAAQFNNVLDTAAPDGFFAYPYLVGALNRHRSVDGGGDAAIIEGLAFAPSCSRVAEIILSMPGFDRFRFRVAIPWVAMAPRPGSRYASDMFWAWHPGFESRVICDDLRCTDNLDPLTRQTAGDDGSPTLEIGQLADAARAAIRDAVLARLMSPRRNFDSDQWYEFPGPAQCATTWDEFHAGFRGGMNNWVPAQPV